MMLAPLVGIVDFLFPATIVPVVVSTTVKLAYLKMEPSSKIIFSRFMHN